MALAEGVGASIGDVEGACVTGESVGITGETVWNFEGACVTGGSVEITGEAVWTGESVG